MIIQLTRTIKVLDLLQFTIELILTCKLKIHQQFVYNNKIMWLAV